MAGLAGKEKGAAPAFGPKPEVRILFWLLKNKCSAAAGKADHRQRALISGRLAGSRCAQTALGAVQSSAIFGQFPPPDEPSCKSVMNGFKAPATNPHQSRDFCGRLVN